MLGSVLRSKLASGPVGGTSDSVFASAHGLYGISGSFPRIRPAGSATLRLCPMFATDQSPERSGTFEAFTPAAGPIGRKFGWARSAADGSRRAADGVCAERSAAAAPTTTAVAATSLKDMLIVDDLKTRT